MQKRPLLHFAVALAVMSPFGAQAQNALDEVMARKSINIAISTDFPP